MFRNLLAFRPRTVGTSCLSAVLVFGILGQTLYGWGGAVAGVVGAWLIHFAFWSLRYRLSVGAWQSIAEEYGLEFREPHEGLAGAEGNGVERGLRVLTPPDERFELAGTIEGREVRMFVEGPADERATVWAVDVADLLPTWLRLKPSAVKAAVSRGLDLSDVDIGHPEFDDRAVIGGHEADRVREFFWEHDLGDVLDELFDHVGPFEIERGWIRHVGEGTTRSERTLRRQLERVRTVANRLEATVGGNTVLGEGEESEETEAAEAAVHVYERG